jgi:hypothetical protein
MDVTLTPQEEAILKQEDGGDQSDSDGLEEEWF